VLYGIIKAFVAFTLVAGVCFAAWLFWKRPVD
jgi:hypothetical protein